MSRRQVGRLESLLFGAAAAGGVSLIASIAVLTTLIAATGDPTFQPPRWLSWWTFGSVAWGLGFFACAAMFTVADLLSTAEEPPA